MPYEKTKSLKQKQHSDAHNSNQKKEKEKNGSEYSVYNFSKHIQYYETFRVSLSKI